MLSKLLDRGCSVSELKPHFWSLASLKVDASFFSNVDMSSVFLWPLFDSELYDCPRGKEGDVAALNQHKDPPWLPLTRNHLLQPFFGELFAFMYDYASIGSNLCRLSHQHSCHLRLFKSVVALMCKRCILTTHNFREVISMYQDWLNLIKSADFVEPRSPWKADCARIIVVCCVRQLLQWSGARTSPSKRTKNCLETVFPILPDQLETREEMSWMRVEGLDECVCRPHDIVNAIRHLEWLHLPTTPFLVVLSDIVKLFTELVLSDQDSPNSSATALLVHVAHCAIGNTMHRESEEVFQLFIDTYDCLVSWSKLWKKKRGAHSQLRSHSYSHTCNSSDCENYLLSSMTLYDFDFGADSASRRFFGLQKKYCPAIVRRRYEPFTRIRTHRPRPCSSLYVLTRPCLPPFAKQVYMVNSQARSAVRRREIPLRRHRPRAEEVRVGSEQDILVRRCQPVRLQEVGTATSE